MIIRASKRHLRIAKTTGGLVEMARKPKIKDIDRGWIKIKRRSKKAKGNFVTVGWQGPTGSSPGISGITMAKLASVHEFGADINHPGGTPYMFAGGGIVFLRSGDPRAIGRTEPHKIRIPARAPMRRSFDRGKKLYKHLLRTACWEWMTSGTLLGLHAVGLRYEGDLKRYIAEGKARPALAKSTIQKRRKKDMIPLVDTGYMLGTITTKLRKEK